MKPQEHITEILDHLQGMWRFRWLAVGIAWLISVSGWIYVYSMPDLYGASAQVFVDTNSLLRPLMQGLTAQQNPLNEVQLMSRAVLARPNLERVAYDTDLTLEAETAEEEEDIVTALQTKVTLQSSRENIFTIEYQHSTREKAVEVVRAILDAFVEDSLGNRDSDAQVSEQALASEIATHERRLLEAENRLGEFKRENLGYMPGDGGDYYARLQTAEAEVSRVRDRIGMLNRSRNELSRQIDGEEPVFGIMASGLEQSGITSCPQMAQIASLENELSTLTIQYTGRHPRISILQDRVDALQQACDEEAGRAMAAGVLTPSGTQQQPLELNPVYQSLRIQLSDTEVELVELHGELETRQATLAGLRRDVDKIVQVETDLKQLNRDYQVISQRHQELLKRWEDLQAKKRLDSVTDSVQFRIVEPPFAYAEPVGPERTILLSATLLFAIAASAGIAFGLNQVQPAFFTRRMLNRSFDLPVIGSVSMILTDQERARRRRDVVAWAIVSLALFASYGLSLAFAGPASALTRDFLGSIGL